MSGSDERPRRTAADVFWLGLTIALWILAIGAAAWLLLTTFMD